MSTESNAGNSGIHPFVEADGSRPVAPPTGAGGSISVGGATLAEWGGAVKAIPALTQALQDNTLAMTRVEKKLDAMLVAEGVTDDDDVKEAATP